jgi:hypothetical protein
LFSLPGIAAFLEKLQYLEAHPGIVVRAFPESCLVLGGIRFTGSVARPVPFAVLGVHKILLDVVPAGESALCCGRIIMVSPEPQVADYILSLDPPLAAVVVFLILEGAVLVESFEAGLGHLEGCRSYLGYEIDIMQVESSLECEP